MNGRLIFGGEHCVYSCVHPLRPDHRTQAVSFDPNTACVSVFCNAGVIQAQIDESCNVTAIWRRSDAHTCSSTLMQKRQPRRKG